MPGRLLGYNSLGLLVQARRLKAARNFDLDDDDDSSDDEEPLGPDDDEDFPAVKKAAVRERPLSLSTNDICHCLLTASTTDLFPAHLDVWYHKHRVEAVLEQGLRSRARQLNCCA